MKKPCIKCKPITRHAVLGKIFRTLNKDKSYPKKSLADITYKLAKALGYK